MSDANFFKRPKLPWQRRYEALRALLVDRRPAAAVAQTYGYTVSYVHYMKHQFKNGLLDFTTLVPQEQKRRRRVTRETREKICDWRRRGLGAGDIAQLLDEEDVELIRAAEMDDQAWEFLSFWKSVSRGAAPTLVFDSRFTSYEKLSELNRAHCLFITLRRRGKELVRAAESLQDWQKIHVPHAKRKYPNLQAHESHVRLRGYVGEIRQIIIRGNGREEPAFLVTNDEKRTLGEIVSDYARRWRVENGIAEAVKFFHLNALSSPILIKVHFDILLTAVADTLYSVLASKLRGFEDCNAQRIHRHFIRGKGQQFRKRD